MYKTETKIEIEAKCDQCKWRKSDDPKLDGWFVVFSTNPAHLEEYRSNPTLLPFMITIQTWDQKRAERPEAKHLCRVECATDFVQDALYNFQQALLPKEEAVAETPEVPQEGADAAS